jgi:hypothetical protein
VNGVTSSGATANIEYVDEVSVLGHGIRVAAAGLFLIYSREDRVQPKDCERSQHRDRRSFGGLNAAVEKSKSQRRHRVRHGLWLS